MGGIFKAGGQIISSAASMLGDRKSEVDYYEDLARDADRQAQYTAAAAQRQSRYLFKSAAERGRELYENYRQTAGTQKTSWAASGLTSNSVTAQTILKNSQFNALLDQEAVNGCAIGAAEAFFQEGRGNRKLLAENLDGEFFG